jgi:hypothetical protein
MTSQVFVAAMPARALLLCASLLLAMLLPSTADAQVFKNLIERLENPVEPFAPAVERILNEHQVGGLSLGEYLVSLDFEGCLQEVREELIPGLGKLRSAHVVALEDRKARVVWQVWDRKLEPLSPDAYLLVEAYLDSPETAKRLYLCDDGLPPSWKRLDVDAYVREAVLWFDIAVAEEEGRLRGEAPADREQAVMSLMETRQALVARFKSTYGGNESTAESVGRLEQRLELMWDRLIDPYHFGFTARGRVDDPSSSSETGRYKAQNPFGSSGIGIPDPRDVAARDKVRKSWKKQRKVLDQEIKETQEALDEAVALIEETPGGVELDRAVRYAARVDAELGQLVSDMERMQNRVKFASTGRPWVDDMLSNGHRRRAVRRLGRSEQKVQTERSELAVAINDAVERGAAPPGTVREPTGGPGRNGGNVASGEPGPGNWLAGLPGVESGTTSAVTADGGIPEGAGWIERQFEGPLPGPSATWSADLVDAIRRRHPELDDADVRILLGLVKAAYRELKGRADVEAAVWRSLTETQGLRIRGEESTLSELYIPGAARAEQPIITFVLTLHF